MDLVRAGNYRQYLEIVGLEIDFDIESVWSEFEDNFSDLSDKELTIELIVNFLVGPIRSNIQHREFQKIMESVKLNAVQKLGSSAQRTSIQKNLEETYERSDESVGLLFNLGFLRYIVEKYGSRELIDLVDNQISIYTDKLTNKLVTDMKS
jgi:hypothetical protein